MDRFVCGRRSLPIEAVPDYWREDRTCSHCGSAHPDDVMQALRDRKVALGPTDKNYKVYLFGGKYRHDKFYFQHLSESEMIEFVSLFNQDIVKIQYPGYFYRMPFFMVALTAV